MAAQPTVSVEAFAHAHANVGAGLADILAEELNASAVAQAYVTSSISVPSISVSQTETTSSMPAPPVAGSGAQAYILTGEVSVFTVADKDDALDLGANLRDVSALVNGQSNIAHVVLQLKLRDVASGEVVSECTAEGLESQFGVRLKTITAGWSASVDFGSDEFRQTNIGHAAYKAIGNAIRWLTQELPRSASVLAVTGDAVVIGFGESSGIAVGDELVIYRLESINNSLGTAVWEDAQRVAAVQVTAVKFDRCLCLVLEGLGYIAEGDTARPLATRTSYPLETDTQ